jgi:hypothetical protein
VELQRATSTGLAYNNNCQNIQGPFSPATQSAARTLLPPHTLRPRHYYSHLLCQMMQRLGSLVSELKLADHRWIKQLLLNVSTHSSMMRACLLAHTQLHKAACCMYRLAWRHPPSCALLLHATNWGPASARHWTHTQVDLWQDLATLHDRHTHILHTFVGYHNQRAPPSSSNSHSGPQLSLPSIASALPCLFAGVSS